MVLLVAVLKLNFICPLFENKRRNDMKTLVLIFVTSIFLVSCGSVEPDSVIDGNYVGTYSITHNYGTDSAYTLHGEITFEFSKGSYKYLGTKYSLPPESGGRYSIVRIRKIFLRDNGIHPADIDPNLLLKGVFDYSFDGERLILEQQDNKYKYYHRLYLNKKENDDDIIM